MASLLIKRKIVSMPVGLWTNFTYSGDCEFELQGGQPIIRFLTSGVLVPKKAMKIDAFLVGGGGSGAFTPNLGMGGGGGGGYVATQKNILLSAGESYDIVIGSGGVAPDMPSSNDSELRYMGNNGSSTMAFGYSVIGGYGGGKVSTITTENGIITEYNFMDGGDGASGGGGAGDTGGLGGVNGSNGDSGIGFYGSPNNNGGRGINKTTRAFEEETGKLYSPGGHGGGMSSGHSEAIFAVNSGGGGNGDTFIRAVVGGQVQKIYHGATDGKSGVVIIRKAV